MKQRGDIIQVDAPLVEEDRMNSFIGLPDFLKMHHGKSNGKGISFYPNFVSYIKPWLILSIVI